MIKTLGVGWIKKGKCGLRDKGLTYKYADLKSLYLVLKEKGIFSFPVENFARFDQASKLATIAVGLALYDADFVYAQGKKQDIGILATNKNGSLDAQLAYFKDYIDSGRTLGRGNLFIYTLPSSPLAEAAIHFGLTGPLLYMNFPDSAKNIRLMVYAQEMIRAGQAKTMLVLKSTNQETACFVVGAL
jgi:hypothetical protein